MPLFIIDTSTVPKGGFRYPGLNGHEINTRSYENLVAETSAHYQANGRPDPGRKQVDEYLCSSGQVQCKDLPEAMIAQFRPFGLAGKPCGTPCGQ